LIIAKFWFPSQTKAENKASKRCSFKHTEANQHIQDLQPIMSVKDVLLKAGYLRTLQKSQEIKY